MSNTLNQALTTFEVSLILTTEHVETLRSMGSGLCVPSVVTPVLYGSALHEMAAMGLVYSSMGVWKLTSPGRQFYKQLTDSEAEARKLRSAGVTDSRHHPLGA